jgi:uncharacterized protein
MEFLSKVGQGVITLSRTAARRFILGKQGLWPGRRWSGKAGTERAMRAMEYLQLDPLQIIARSQDLSLHSRVVNYTPGLWEQLCYGDRKFFDWGGWLAVRPMEELPQWRAIMQHEKEIPRWRAFARKHRHAIEEMRGVLQAKATVSNRDFQMHTRRRVDNYRGRKDSSIALYYLWRIGEVMTHHRERFERVYALAERVAPPHLLREASEHELEAFLVRKAIAFHGLHRMNALGSAIGHSVKPNAVARMGEVMLSDGELVAAQIEGSKELHYALACDAKHLRDLAAGRTPREWKPRDTTTREEVTFIAPLDVVLGRARARALFDFDYVWEVYKPLHQRKWGYYTLPILWHDTFVARTDMKLDRATSTLMVKGFWLEDRRIAGDADFAESLRAGYSRLMRFIGATTLDASAIELRSLRRLLSSLNERPK